MGEHQDDTQDQIEVHAERDPPRSPKGREATQKKKPKKTWKQRIISRIFSFFRINYFKLHVLYIFSIGIIGSLILFGTEHNRTGLSFIDALFFGFTSVCSTGFVTVDQAKWSVGSHVVLIILSQLGSTVLMTLPIVLVRRYHLRVAFRGEKTSVRETIQHSNSAILTSSTTTQLMVNENLEYRSLGKLLMLIPLYWFFIQFCGFIIMGAYLSNKSSEAYRIVEQNGSDPWFWGFFSAQTAFTNVGMTLFSDNLIPYAKDRLILLVMSVLIACGNTLYPVFLRLLVWLGSKVSRDKAPYENLLANPRVYFTHLFPAKQTNVLMISWIVITALQMGFFMWFDFDNRVLIHASTSDLFLMAFFQSVSIRTGGFNIVDVAVLSNALLVLYLIMMYLSAYPFIVSLRETAVNSKYQQGELAHSRRKRTQAVIKDIVGRDMLVLYVATLIICMIEDAKFPNSNFTVFHVLFEVVSAFGTAGISLGYPGVHYSFSGTLFTLSKLIVIVMMFLGRHRGLPESVDSAVNTREFAPLERLIHRDEEYFDDDDGDQEMQEKDTDIEHGEK